MTKIKSIIIEGSDGTGKTTLVRNLAAKFSSEGWVVIPIAEPNKLIRGLRDIAKKAEIVQPDLEKIKSTIDIPFEELYVTSSPCSEASIAIMIACMAQSCDFVRKLSAQLAGTNKKILVLKDRSIISTFVYQALVPMKLHLIQNIWNSYSSLISEDWNAGCVILDSTESVATSRHEKDCHYDSNTKQILGCYRLVPQIFGMSRDQYFNFVQENNKPRELSNRFYETLNERSRLALMSRIPRYHVLNTSELDADQTTKAAARKINEWIG
jgi:thymidylate kinase